MKHLSFVAVLFGCASACAGEPSSRLLVDGLKKPASVAVGVGGQVFLTAADPNKDGAGVVLRIADGKAVPFAAVADDVRGIAAYQAQQQLFAVSRQRVWRIDKAGTADILTAPNAFPTPPWTLTDIAVDQESGQLYVSDSGDPKGAGAVYRVTPQGLVSMVVDGKRFPGLHLPTALAMDGASHLLVGDASGDLYRIKLVDGSAEKLAEGLGIVAGLGWDHHGRLYVSDADGGRLLVITRPGEKPILAAKGFQIPGDICLDPSGKQILVADSKAGTLTAVPAVAPGAEVDETPLPVRSEIAFPDLQWAGWKGETDDGKPNPLRPIVLTHAGDGSNRIFVATEQGVVHVFPNDQKATKTKVFLDIHDRVSYDDAKNEEGFLGLVFHPKYKENGELFVFYTTKKAPLTNVLSRFHVSKDDPDRADPDSEEELLRITKPFWNHDGGVLCFGPDGFLYFTHGDGGAGNDLYDNGQNINALLGKVLRIDVDHKDPGKAYAIPKDNPFADRPDARPEVWAYGLRNVWRMSFDDATGRLWSADVGQNLFEEIDFIQKGANYGWNRREGLHPFGARGMGPRSDFTEPVWEYDHEVGKCIIGGYVYHGSRLPELNGYYVYGDFVTTKLWALRYDDAKGRVVANRPIQDRAKAMFSFGEDEKGEIYMLTAALDGKGIYWFGK